MGTITCPLLSQHFEDVFFSRLVGYVIVPWRVMKMLQPPQEV